MRSYLRMLATLVVVIFCASTRSEAGLVISMDPEHVAYGSTFNGVGYVERTDDTGSYIFNASGVLINSNWVLMSAHQALAIDSDTNSVYGSFRFGLGSNFMTNPGERMIASELFLNPNYGGAAGLGFDQALLYFDNPFATAAPINLYTGNVVPGNEADIVGYGPLQIVNNPNLTLTGDRRAGTNVITEVNSLGGADYARTIIAPPFLGPEFYREFGMGGKPGDSGGGLLINGELAGITSFGGFSNTYGQSTNYSLLDYDWINTTIASRPPTAVPEPSSILFLLVTGPALLFRRFRKTA